MIVDHRTWWYFLSEALSSHTAIASNSRLLVSGKFKATSRYVHQALQVTFIRSIIMHLSMYCPTYPSAGICGDRVGIWPLLLSINPPPGEAPVIKRHTNPHLLLNCRYLCRCTNEPHARHASLHYTHLSHISVNQGYYLRSSTNVTVTLYIA